MTWLTAKAAFGLARYWWILIAIATVTGLWFAYTATLDRMTEQATEVGTVKQQNANLTETIRNVEKANVAAETMRRDPAASRAECLRNARNPEDC